MIPLQNYLELHKLLVSTHGNAREWEAAARAGDGKETWVHDGGAKRFAARRVLMTLYWLLSDDTHAMAYSDFHISQTAIETHVFLEDITPVDLSRRPKTPQDYQGEMVRRDRPAVEGIFRALKNNRTLDVGAQLEVIYTAMEASSVEAGLLVDVTGPVTTQKFVVVEGIPTVVGKPFSELGKDPTAWADSLDIVASEIAKLVDV